MSDEEISEVKQLIHEKEMEIAQMEQRMLRNRASRTERLFAHLIDERSRENIEDSIDPDNARSQESIEDLSELIKDDPDSSDSDVIDDVHSSTGGEEISGIIDIGDASTSPCPSPPLGGLPRKEPGVRRRPTSAAKKTANIRPSLSRVSERANYQKRPDRQSVESHAKGHGNGRPTSAPSTASARHETAPRQRPSSAHPLPGRRFRQMPGTPNDGTIMQGHQSVPTPPCNSRETIPSRSRATPPVMHKSRRFQPKGLFEHDEDLRHSFHVKARKSPLFPRPASAFVQRKNEPEENRPPFVVIQSNELQRRPQSARSPTTGDFLRKGHGGRVLWQVREEKVAKTRMLTPRHGEPQLEMRAADAAAQEAVKERARAHLELLKIASERAERIQEWRGESKAEKLELHRVWVEGQRRLMVRKRAVDRAKRAEQTARERRGAGPAQAGAEGELGAGQRKMLSIKVLWAKLTPAALHHGSPEFQYMRLRVGGREFRTENAAGDALSPEWTDATFHSALPHSHAEVEVSWHVLLPGGREQERGRASAMLSGRMDAKCSEGAEGVIRGGREQSLTTLQLRESRKEELVGTCSIHFHFDRSVIPASVPERSLSAAVAESEAALAAEEEEVHAMVQEAEKLVQRSQDDRWAQLQELHARQQQLAQHVGALSPRSGYAPPKPATPSVSSMATSPQRRAVDEDAVAMAIRVYACPNHFVNWTPTTGEQAVSFHTSSPPRSPRRTLHRSTRRRSPSHTFRQIGSCSTSPGKIGAVPPPSGDFDVPPVRSPREPNVLRTCWRPDQDSNSRDGSPTIAAVSDSEKGDFDLRFYVHTNHCHQPKPRDPADVLHAREGDRRRERLSQMAHQRREQDADAEAKAEVAGVKTTFCPKPNLLFPQPADTEVANRARREKQPDGPAPTTPRRGRSAWPLGSPRARSARPLGSPRAPESRLATRGRREIPVPQSQTDQAM